MNQVVYLKKVSEKIIDILNDSNVALSKLMAVISNAKRAGTAPTAQTYEDMLQLCNTIMSHTLAVAGSHQVLISSIDAQTAAPAESVEPTPDEMVQDHTRLQEQMTSSEDASSETLAMVLQKGIDRISAMIPENKSIVNNQAATIEKILSDESPLYRYLSNKVIECGAGVIAPTAGVITAYRESILETPLTELHKYPEGFYNFGPDAVDRELYFKDNSVTEGWPMEFLWVYSGDVKRFLVRINQQEWIPIEALSKSAVTLAMVVANRRLFELSTELTA